jgi:hypothetical protein
MRLILISGICANVFMITYLYCSGLMAVRHCWRKACFFLATKHMMLFFLAEGSIKSTY